jgi:hypothetical protein
MPKLREPIEPGESEASKLPAIKQTGPWAELIAGVEAVQKFEIENTGTGLWASTKDVGSEKMALHIYAESGQELVSVRLIMSDSLRATLPNPSVKQMTMTVQLKREKGIFQTHGGTFAETDGKRMFEMMMDLTKASLPKLTPKPAAQRREDAESLRFADAKQRLMQKVGISQDPPGAGALPESKGL